MLMLMLRLTESQGTSSIDEQQDATPKGKNNILLLIERPPLVGKVNANFFGWRVPRDQRDGSSRPYSQVSRTSESFRI
jgi:hypothetical protein